jgi:hypothetical protein
MKNLETYLEQKNQWNAIFGHDAMSFPLSQADANDLMNSIASELSPENLHCDGEASITHVRKKAKFLDRVQTELEQYCLNNWLDTPECIY